MTKSFFDSPEELVCPKETPGSFAYKREQILKGTEEPDIAMSSRRIDKKKLTYSILGLGFCNCCGEFSQVFRKKDAPLAEGIFCAKCIINYYM